MLVRRSQPKPAPTRGSLHAQLIKAIANHVGALQLRGGESAGDSNRAHAGSVRGLNTGWRILDDDTPFSVAPEGLRGGKIALGIRLSETNVIGRHQRRWNGQADVAQTKRGDLARARGHDSPRVRRKGRNQ